MASHLSFLVVLALTATAAVSAFDIVDSSSDSIMVKEGEDIELWCSTRWRSDDYWEWCDITHVPSNRTCEHVFDESESTFWENVYQIWEKNCSDFAGRFEYIGDKKSSGYLYKCGIRLKDIRPEDAGEWKCDITGYYDGYDQWKQWQKDQGKTASKSFHVNVTAMTTTTMSTNATPKPTTNTTPKPTSNTTPKPTTNTTPKPTTQPGINKVRKVGAWTYLIIILVAIVVCVVIVLCTLHYKKKLPAFKLPCFKLTDQNEKQEGAARDDLEGWEWTGYHA